MSVLSGYFKSVEKFIQASDDQLEFETQDELKETPLLVAVRAGMSNMETISIIIRLGGEKERGRERGREERLMY